MATTTVTKAGDSYVFENAGITYRVMQRPRGFSFVDGPNDLLGTFLSLDAAGVAFTRYANKFNDAEAIADNPLTPADPDIAHGTILDERIVKYGLPPTNLVKPPVLTADEVLAHVKHKLGADNE